MSINVGQSPAVRDLLGKVNKDNAFVKVGEDGTLKKGYSTIAGAIKFSKLSDKPVKGSSFTNSKGVKETNMKASDRQRHIMETVGVIHTAIYKQAAADFGSALRRQDNNINSVDQQEMMDAVKDKVGAALSRILLADKVDSNHGARRITVGQVKSAVSVASKIANESLREYTVKKAIDSQLDKIADSAARKFASKATHVSDSQINVFRNTTKAAVKDFLKGRAEKMGSIGEMDIYNAEQLANQLVEKHPSLSDAGVSSPLPEEAPAPTEQSHPQATSAKAPAKDVPDITRQRADDAVKSFQERLPKTRVSFTESKERSAAAERLRSDVRQMTTNILLSDKAGALDEAVQAAVNAALAPFQSVRRL